MSKKKVQYPQSFHNHNEAQKNLQKLGKKYKILNHRNQRFWPTSILIEYNELNDKTLNYGKCIDAKCSALIQRKNYKKHRSDQCKYSKWDGEENLFIFELDPCDAEWVKCEFKTYTQGDNKKNKRKRKREREHNQISIFDAFNNNKNKRAKKASQSSNKIATAPPTFLTNNNKRNIEDIIDCVDGVFMEYDQKIEFESDIDEYVDYSSVSSAFTESESEQKE
eukprot:86085_1